MLEYREYQKNRESLINAYWYRKVARCETEFLRFVSNKNNTKIAEFTHFVGFGNFINQRKTLTFEFVKVRNSSSSQKDEN